MPRTVRAASLAFIVCSTPAVADNATLLQKFGSWSAFSASGAPKVCFAAAQPKSMTPKTAKRGPVFFYISQWPADQVSGEVSVKMGYPFKPGATATVTIGTQKFPLFPKDARRVVESAE